uniref:Secreted protein n=1 Tax=Syphacia muris TaxID=451379 RepID=A0A0N5AZK3_9BILA
MSKLTCIAAVLVVAVVVAASEFGETQFDSKLDAEQKPLQLLDVIKRDTVTIAPRFFASNSTEMQRFKRQSGCGCCCHR